MSVSPEPGKSSPQLPLKDASESPDLNVGLQAAVDVSAIPYSILTKVEKWFIVSLIALAGLFR